MKISALILALAVAAPFAHGAKKYTPLEKPGDVRVEVDVDFLGASRKEKADLYFPLSIAKGQKVPAVIVIHGGGFNDGDKGRQREINTCRTLALNGYAAMSINYKLSIKDKATWPQSVLDAKTAVRWLRTNAGRLQIDPAKIGAIGYSAGGNLSSMLAVTQPKDGFEPAGDGATNITCAIDIYGAVDLINYHDMKMFNKTRAEAPELYRKGSPTTYVDNGDAPMLLIHGTADETVPMSQSETLAKALKAAGVEHELVIIPDAPHTFDLELKQRDLRPVVLGFLDKHLKKAAH